ncbi:MAG: DMT family transporter [Nitrospirae bacterium]|nr:DMT family transporter [Nitrospirota bacterium]MDE3219659.1 DMT family transporter [Nitrospirota bacterium]
MLPRRGWGMIGAHMTSARGAVRCSLRRGERAHPSTGRCSHGRLFGVATASVFLLRYRALQTISPATVAVYQNLTPVCAILFAHLYLGEPIQFSTMVGGAIILLGAEMVRRANQPQLATNYLWAKRCLGSLAGNRTSN